jgi:beta-lactamase regulating signal transducer with metallopeptidase domain
VYIMTEALFLYSVKSALVLTLLYLPYMLILRKESFFRLNRTVLLLILLLSLVLPLMNIHSLSWDNQPVVQAARQQMVEVGIPVNAGMLLPEVAVQGERNGIQVSWFHIVSILFVLGTLFVFFLRVSQILRMGYVIRTGSLWHQREDGVMVYCHADDVSPFSWMDNIVISARDYDENAREILLHERGHVMARHSWDLLLLALLQTMQWWNPLVYILGGSLRDVHEYEADDFVLRSGVSAKAYQLLLIKKVVGASSYTFANNFDHSLTLKRITMMQKSKSSVWMRSKVLYIIPMATLALSAFATSESVSPSGNEIAKNEDKVIKISPSGQADGTKKVGSSVVFPTDSNVVCLLDGKEATQETARALSPEEIESITVVKNPEAAASMGYPGKTVQVIKTKKDGAVLSSYDTPQKVSYVPNPGVQAQFKGGEGALMKWLATNIKYPSEAQSQGVMGRVQVEFFITETGQITNIRAIAFGKHAPEGSKTLPEAVVMAYAKEKKAEGKELSAQEQQAYKRAVEALLAESVRVVGAMPAWEPGYVDKEKTKPCTIRYVLPLVFRLG